MKAVCIGDSLTFGYGVSRKDRWSETVRKELNIELINRGVNGDTTAGMLSRSYEDAIKSKPDIVIIMGGTNDFICGRSEERVEENISALCQEAAMNNIIPIIVIQPPIAEEIAKRFWNPHVDYGKANSSIKNYRKWVIDNKVSTNVNYIDIYKTILELCNTQNKKEYYIDGIHLTEKGHNVIAKLVIDKLINIGL